MLCAMDVHMRELLPSLVGKISGKCLAHASSCLFFVSLLHRSL